MTLVRWPTDPKGKAPSHNKTWAAHQAALRANAPAKPGEVKISKPGGGYMPVSEWDFGNGKGVLTPDAAPAALAPAPAPLIEGSMGTLPLPVDAAFDDEMAGLQKTLTDDQAGITGARTRGKLDYGFNEDANTGALSFDPNNPFSRAALLKKNYDVSRASAGQTMGSRGQLYAGAYQTAQDSVNRGQLGAEDTLQKSLAGFLANNSAAMTRAGTNYETNAARAEGKRTARANSNPLYSPTAGASDVANLPGTTGPPKGGVTIPAPPKKGLNTIPAPKVKTLSAGPGIKGTKTKRKGNVVTYSNSTKGP